jgi:hypothetical protein
MGADRAEEALDARRDAVALRRRQRKAEEAAASFAEMLALVRASTLQSPAPRSEDAEPDGRTPAYTNGPDE